MHKAGLRVINHTTSTFIPIEAMKKPEFDGMWSCDIRTGKVALRDKGTGYDDAVFADMNDPEWRRIVLGNMKDYMQTVRPDAFMTDEVEWLPTVYAGGSKRGSWAKFRKRYGRGYPEGAEVGDYDSPAWRAYLKFRMDSGGDFYRDLTAHIREANPHAMVTGCLAGISKHWRRTWAMGGESWLAGWSLGFYEMEEGSAAGAKAGRGFLYSTLWPTYYREMSLYNAAAEAGDYWVTYSLGYPQTWGVENSEQFYAWALTHLMGHRYWMRDYQAELQWFQWEAQHEADLVRPRWIADVGVFFPEYSRDYVADPTIAYEDWAGVSEALAENLVMSDQLLRWHLEGDRLDRFRVVVIPSERFLSPEMAATLERFVRRGGALVVTADSGVSDLMNKPVDNGPFLRLCGIASRGEWVAGAKKVELSSGSLAFEDGYQRVTAAPGARTQASVGGDPAVIVNHVGRGRVVYLAGRIGRAAYQTQWFGKSPVFKRDADPAQRKAIATLVAELAGKRRVELNGVPEDVMVNAFDSHGHDVNAPRRVIAFLDSIGGYKDGEAWPAKGQRMAPLTFAPMARRTGGKPIAVRLRDIGAIRSARLVSPDFDGGKPLTFTKTADGFLLTIPAEAMGRYSAAVVEYGK